MIEFICRSKDNKYITPGKTGSFLYLYPTKILEQ